MCHGTVDAEVAEVYGVSLNLLKQKNRSPMQNRYPIVRATHPLSAGKQQGVVDSSSIYSQLAGKDVTSQAIPLLGGELRYYGLPLRLRVLHQQQRLSRRLSFLLARMLGSVLHYVDYEHRCEFELGIFGNQEIVVNRQSEIDEVEEIFLVWKCLSWW